MLSLIHSLEGQYLVMNLDIIGFFKIKICLLCFCIQGFKWTLIIKYMNLLFSDILMMPFQPLSIEVLRNIFRLLYCLNFKPEEVIKTSGIKNMFCLTLHRRFLLDPGGMENYSHVITLM